MRRTVFLGKNRQFLAISERAKPFQYSFHGGAGMHDVSFTPIPGGRKFLNDGFGNRCTIDGSCFDEGGYCSHGHEHGAIYYRPAEEPKAKEAPAAPEPKKTATVTCGVFSSCRCTICGGFFADGDDICGLGQHEIGQQYPARVAA